MNEFISGLIAIGIEAAICGIAAIFFGIGYKVGKGKKIDE